MNKNKKSIGLYLTLVAGIIAIVEAVYYGKVMYTFQPVYYFLAAAIVLAVLSFVLVGFNKVITGFIPVVNAALMASMERFRNGKPDWICNFRIGRNGYNYELYYFLQSGSSWHDHQYRSFFPAGS